MAFVYILESLTTGRFYVGSTNDFDRRLEEHQRGHTPSTRGRGPWKLAYRESFPSLREARRRELEIKRWKSAKLIRQLIGVEYAQSRPTCRRWGVLMSEYQYYDFRAIDQPLTKAEIAALQSISTRAAITSTSFTNHYEWGDLKADPLKLLEKYFDAFVYVANWGTRTFYLRIPHELADYDQISAMLPGEATWVRKVGRHLIIGFDAEVDLDEDWDDGSGWMGSLLSLRSDLLRGDLRCLYLGWLLCVQCEEFPGEDLEPPVPPGLRELSASLRALIEFLGIDEDLVEVAASASAPLSSGPGRKELAEWIQYLPEEEKNDLLVTAALQSGERWKIELQRRFQKQGAAHTSHPPEAIQPRTVHDLLTAAQARAEERIRQLEAKRAAEAARQKAKEEADRARYLDQLAKNEGEIWNRITAHIQKRQPNEYDRAVSLLIDLRDLAVRKQRVSEFQTALEELRHAHAAKQSLLLRLAKVKFG
jgi:predicted GIY-YIG superfamily endonuclease